jgi:DNA-binding CsgD family transcriptional regulator
MLLSPRESPVVELMGKGLSRAEISDRLGVSRKCVSVFIERARGKFHLKTALQLRHLAFRLILIHRRPPTFVMLLSRATQRNETVMRDSTAEWLRPLKERAEHELPPEDVFNLDATGDHACC